MKNYIAIIFGLCLFFTTKSVLADASLPNEIKCQAVEEPSDCHPVAQCNPDKTICIHTIACNQHNYKFMCETSDSPFKEVSFEQAINLLKNQEILKQKQNHTTEQFSVIEKTIVDYSKISDKNEQLIFLHKLSKEIRHSIQNIIYPETLISGFRQ